MSPSTATLGIRGAASRVSRDPLFQGGGEEGAYLALFHDANFSLNVVILLCIAAPLSMMGQPHLISVCGAGKTEWEGRVGFTSQALAAVHRLSGGIPRLINLICDRALLAGYVQGTRSLSAKMIEMAAAEADPATALAAYMQPDGIHPNAAGVALIVEALGPEVERLIARVPQS